MPSSDVVLVMTTVADDEAAETLARALVEERLAACHMPRPVRIDYPHFNR